MYSVEGTFLNQPVDVLWDDGYVDGSDEFMLYLHEFLRLNPEEGWGPPGRPKRYGEDAFNDPWAFLMLLRRLLPDGKVVDGSLPPGEVLPDGVEAGP
jgi:hypothetical protein